MKLIIRQYNLLSDSAFNIPIINIRYISVADNPPQQK